MLAIGRHNPEEDFDLSRAQVLQLVGFAVAFVHRIECECEDFNSDAVQGIIDNAVPRIVGLTEDPVDRRAELQELVYG